MFREEITRYSRCLERDMHIMVYGHDGLPFLAFPTQDSMCHNFEDFGMIHELRDYLEHGRIRLFVVDTVGPPRTGTRASAPCGRSSIIDISPRRPCPSSWNGQAACSP